MLALSTKASIKTLTHQFICSWSGGKDACLALYLMQQHGHIAKGLLTMMGESGQQSRAHHLPDFIIQQQATALGLPAILQATTKKEYQSSYLNALAKSQKLGADSVVLGDIDIQAHRDWQAQQATKSQLTALFPLWLNNHKKLVEYFIDAGFKATIMAIHPDKCPESFLGKVLNKQTIKVLEKHGIDVCAEGGEFHTVVTDGPNFSQAISLNPTSISDGEFGYRYLNFASSIQ